MGMYFDLKDEKAAKDKEFAFLNREKKYVARQMEFSKIPGNPIAYWVSDKTISNFDNLKKVCDYADGRIGLITGDGARFIKLWHEVANENIGFGMKNNQESIDSKKTWFPIQNGGGYRKWYGNLDSVVNWRDDGHDMKFDNSLRGRVRSHNYNGDFAFQEGITWTTISTSRFSCRYADYGFIYDTAGPFCILKNAKNLYVLLGLLQSKITENYMAILNPTINFPPGYITALPFDLSLFSDNTLAEINDLVKNCIINAKEDWDAYETSWDFQKHPLLSSEDRIEENLRLWKEQCNNRIEQLMQNETRLNEIYIKAYGLENELSSQVEKTEITVRVANEESNVKSFISYAVGCILGRYSLKEDGLIFAGGNWDESKYPDDFKPCEYGIIPITENQYFGEDLCTRVIDFIKVVYGENTLNENLKFIANALKPDSFEAPKKIIRGYLFNGFFDNHYQIYQHRPIYWQLDSGKAGGFRAIMYMHRFNENTLSTVRTEYIQELRYKYEDELQRLQHKLGDAKTTAEKNEVKKQATAIDKKLVECTIYDDLLNHVTGNIKNYVFDLDDGVKTNYAKFLSIDGDKTKNVLTVIKL